MKQNVKVGLALGSGSARGFAHIGVLEVLEKHLPIEIICGSSMGAVIGAIYCCGTDLRMLAKFAETLTTRSLMDLKVPKKGFVKGEKIYELLRVFTKDMSFEEVEMEFGVMACDIARGASVLLREGKICDAVRASMSIPGVFVPVEMDDKMLVDGGVLERVPVGVTRELGADFVVGVDVGYVGEERRPPKGTFEMFQYTLDIMGWEAAKQKAAQADYIIVPQVQKVSSMSFGKAKFFIDEGREAALAALPEIMALYEQKTKELAKLTATQ
ncbi:patatin-like phospholipase family protein [Clostridia bacterium OttesenSCG-928-F22]|nr:patatin-like phospholipase family protein [Clostridia bacterium OttesenSCG-928-F22]